MGLQVLCEVREKRMGSGQSTPRGRSEVQGGEFADRRAEETIMLEDSLKTGMLPCLEIRKIR